MFTRGARMNTQEYDRPVFALYKAQAALVVLLVTGLAGFAQEAKTPAAVVPAKQRLFDSADQAADALIQAASNFDIAQLEDILGPRWSRSDRVGGSGAGQRARGTIRSEGA